jgi:hypothetical protein
VIVPVGDFEVKPHKIVNVLEPGQVYTSQFTVKNTGSPIEDIKLEKIWETIISHWFWTLPKFQF